MINEPNISHYLATLQITSIIQKDSNTVVVNYNIGDVGNVDMSRSISDLNIFMLKFFLIFPSMMCIIQVVLMHAML